MEDTKVLKSYCEISKKYYGIVVKKLGGEWKIVDFIPVSAESGKLMASPSDVRQDKYLSNGNLLPCSKGGSRVACSCALKSGNCSPSMGYNFQCLYCSNLKIDYTKPRSVSGHRSGEIIQLDQGQVIKIEFDDRALTNIKVGVGWDPAYGGNNMDVDSSVIVAGNGGYETVYYHDLNHPSGCVVHHGDNLTGDGQGDDENITVKLDKVPANRDRLIFVINIYNCYSRSQTLASVKNMYITLSDIDSGETLCQYRVKQDMLNDTAIVIGMAFRDGGSWAFKAVGSGRRVGGIGELAENVKNLR